MSDEDSVRAEAKRRSIQTWMHVVVSALALLTVVLVMWRVLASPHHSFEQFQPVTDDPGTLAVSLVKATSDFCIPYVVDGASIVSLTRRADVFETHVNVHGKSVTRYVLGRQPGSPSVTFSRGDYCAIRLDVESWVDREVVDAEFRSNLQLDARPMSEARDLRADTEYLRAANRRVVTCVHGRSSALITMSQGPAPYPIIVTVTSEDRYCGQ